jgi:16S rRNA (guanine527-N7)-methyltransferase
LNHLKLLLVEGLSDLKLWLDDNQIDRLLDYLILLEKWNKSYNLTAIHGLEKMLNYHLLDSLAIYPAVQHFKNVLDVGSGAGLPGVPLAIAMPDSNWTLLDSNGKKTRFIQQALAVCKVSNAKVVKSRVQDYTATHPLDIIVSRAYASLGDFADSVAHLRQADTLLVTMKTGLDPQELKTLDTIKHQIQASSIDEIELSVPGIAEKRSLVIVKGS